MSDLIDRNALLKALDYEESKRHLVKPGSTFDIILRLPAVEVRHGRWIKKQNPQWKAHSHDMCSICGWWNTKNAMCYEGTKKPGHSLNYCPNCGHPMDGGEK